MTYLDHAATSPLRAAARDAWLQAAEVTGNASATHGPGRTARRLLEEARESIAADLGAHPGDVILTSGGTEADNLAILGTARASRVSRPRVVVSAVEHPAVLESAGMLAREGHDVVLAPVDAGGRLALPALGELVTEQTSVVSVMWANNETGVVQPVADAVAAAHEAGALAHSDAVQAVGHCEVDFGGSGLDLMSLSGHKLGTPVGIGALIVRRGVEMAAIGAGGGQERGIRSGTSDVAGARALQAALHEAVTTRADESRRLRALRDAIADALAAVPGVRITAADLPEDQRLPGIVHAVLDGVRAEHLLFALDRAGIAASAGSACRAGVHQPSHVVLAMGGSPEDASGALRCSLGWTTTAEDVAHFARVIPGAVEMARAAGHRRPARPDHRSSPVPPAHHSF